MSDSTLRLKQEIIKAEIIDKNYDKEKFLNFCIQKKEHGDDLQNWSILELNETISEFINIENGQIPSQQPDDSSQQPYQPQIQQPYQPQVQQPYQPQIQQPYQPQIQNPYQPQPLQQNPTANKQPQHLHEQIKNKAAEFISGLFSKIGVGAKQTQQTNIPITGTGKHYEKEINCKKLEKTILNDKEITVVLQNPKSSDTSLLKATYVTYEVSTEAMKWLVRRRYSDFDWLRNIFVKCFPRLFIPPIPGKKLGNRRFEEDFIQKRMSFLQRFMDSVMISEELKTSEALVAFLSLTDRAQFESKMKELTSFIPSPYVEDMKTLSGKLLAVDSDIEDQYFSNIGNYFTLQGQLMARMNYNFKNFYLNISAACTNLEEIQKDFDTLQLLNTKVAMVRIK